MYSQIFSGRVLLVKADLFGDSRTGLGTTNPWYQCCILVYTAAYCSVVLSHDALTAHYAAVLL